MQASSETRLSKETGMSLKSTADAPVSMFLHPVSQHADIARPRPMCLPCVQAPPQLSARHTATLGWPRAWKSKSCSVCVCIINSSPVQCYATAAVWPKPMGFWTAPRASRAEAQHSVFFHVEISHPEALECILPTETTFLFIPQFLLSVLWFVLSLLFLSFLRFTTSLGTHSRPHQKATYILSQVTWSATGFTHQINESIMPERERGRIHGGLSVMIPHHGFIKMILVGLQVKFKSKEPKQALLLMSWICVCQRFSS